MANKRDLPWRHLSDQLDMRFYEVLVSELMLQQTQVSRVTIKYREWMTLFPTLIDVANAPFTKVLSAWQGLGYNRRAKYLHDCCKYLANLDPKRWHGELDNLPGVGINTKGAILAYCYNEPAVFVETNIRTVIMIHFLKESKLVHDRDIRNLVSMCVDAQNPREWYWAMMDYGSFLKKSHKVNSHSAHYRKQTRFEGSLRQLRARILDALLQKSMTYEQIRKAFDDTRIDKALEGLIKDKIVHKSGAIYQINEVPRPEKIKRVK